MGKSLRVKILILFMAVTSGFVFDGQADATSSSLVYASSGRTKSGSCKLSIFELGQGFAFVAQENTRIKFKGEWPTRAGILQLEGESNNGANYLSQIEITFANVDGKIQPTSYNMTLKSATGWGSNLVLPPCQNLQSVDDGLRRAVAL